MKWPVKSALIGLVLLALTACSVLGPVARDWVERDGGAVVTYVSDGVNFDPLEDPALGVTIVAESESPIILAGGQPNCLVEAEVVLKCRLGRVESPITVRYTGTNVIASAAYRRVGAGNTVFLNFAR